jgi:poly(3-hydroxybutyrate) depolymerase
MIPHPIKSKTQQFYAFAQTINQTKIAPILSIFKNIKTVLKLQIAKLSLEKLLFTKRNVVGNSFLVVIVAALLLASCQKEELSDPVLNSTTSGDLSASALTNTPPKVNAGPMRVVVYPASTSATLSGSASDADGGITYRWKQTDGPTTANIAQPTKPGTAVTNLKLGLYTFVLVATDKKGASNTDTTTVTVLEKVTWNVEGVTREALVHPSSRNSGSAPVIIAFHGHGGTDVRYAEKEFELSWPEAIVVYPQGLPTKSGGDKTGKQPGWQNSVGEVNSRTGIKDQDLKFFDAMLPKLQQRYNANLNQVFIHGWSDGGDFIYNVLWTARGSKLAALAPAGATLRTIDGKRTMPVIHAAGTDDTRISFSKQQQSSKNDRILNKCSSTGTVWAKGPGGLLGTHYSSPIDDDVVFLQYDGGHIFPSTVQPEMVKFFKEVAGIK